MAVVIANPSDDVREGIRAVFEKRSPVFGRASQRHCFEATLRLGVDRGMATVSLGTQSKIALAVLVWTLTASVGHAAEPDPVISAYRTYVAAKQKDDLKGAEAAAAQALAASEARDGAGGSTAALAFNLALARMDLHEAKQAIEPARRALDLATAGAKGVDPLTAKLTLGEAELTADAKANEDSLAKALKEAENRPDLDDFAYPAAMALTKAALVTHRKDQLILAWQAVATHAPGAHGDLNLVRGRALTEVAISLLSEHKFEEASDAVDQAISLLVKVAPEDADWDRTTVGESYYADALALRSAVEALHDAGPRKRKFGAEGRRPIPGQAVYCGGAVTPRPLPDFPIRPAQMGEIGAVVVRFRTDASGAVFGVRVISTLINSDFRKAVEDSHIRWTYQPDRKPGCRVASNDRLQVVSFRFGY